MKYIVTENEEGDREIFLFPRTVNHDCMMDTLRRIKDTMHGNWRRIDRNPVSAGFVALTPTPYCYGDSETLGLKNSDGDTELLRNQLTPRG